VKIRAFYARSMQLGIKRPKISIGSWSSRRLHLGVAHHGTATSWQAPQKEVTERSIKNGPTKKKRR
jgi:hypothetical protein